MPQLSDGDRAKLPDRAFAYIDSRGARRLPINDEAHVRNALARFGQVAFEDDAARERARTRLLNAAKKYGIVPVGFIAAQLESERRLATAARLAADVSTWPTGLVTFLMTDIEGSTGLLQVLGDRYARLLDDVRGMVRRAVVQAGGREVDARADEFFAAFAPAASAVEAAVHIQRTMGAATWPDALECRVRVGIHSGRPMLTDSGYVGLSVHAAARVCQVGHGGQIVVSGETKAAADALPEGVRLRDIGRHRLRGLPRAEALFQVEAAGLLTDFPPLRTDSPPPPESAPEVDERWVRAHRD